MIHFSDDVFAHIHPLQRFVNAIEASQETMDSIREYSSTRSTDETASRESCRDELSAAASPAPVMVSGAGHDAMAVAEVAKMGMLFVRCRGGVSHSPLEHVEPDDVAAASAAIYHYILIRATRR